jgi:hypothetical protein
VITLHDWLEKMLFAHDLEPCPRCGRSTRAYDIDLEGIVWSWCGWCEHDVWTARVTMPANFAQETAGADLPF